MAKGVAQCLLLASIFAFSSSNAQDENSAYDNPPPAAAGKSDNSISGTAATAESSGAPLSSAKLFAIPSYLQATNNSADNIAVQWNLAIQYVLRQGNLTNIAPRIFGFVHLAMWQALRANNASENPCEPNAVATYAAMIAIKNIMPVHFDKYNALVEQHTSPFSDAALKNAYTLAAGVVVELLTPSLNDGFQSIWPPAPLTGKPGEFVDIGVPDTMPNQQYAQTKPLLLPLDLETLGFVANYTAPPPVPSPAYNVQYTPTLLYGDFNSTLRSPDQTSTAIFWADRGPTPLPPSATKSAGVQAQWNRLAVGTLPYNLSLEDTSKVLAMINVGMYDCLVANFVLKYRFNTWRPITAIRNGDPEHAPVPDWTPLLATPNLPSYPSTSGCYGGVVGRLLTDFHGRDAFTFSVATENRGISGEILPSRQYTSFVQVGMEVSQSRYFGGLEFPEDSFYALDFGGEVADYILEHWETLDPDA